MIDSTRKTEIRRAAKAARQKVYDAFHSPGSSDETFFVALEIMQDARQATCGDNSEERSYFDECYLYGSHENAIKRREENKMTPLQAAIIEASWNAILAEEERKNKQAKKR